jgi:hypothetical protein
MGGEAAENHGSGCVWFQMGARRTQKMTTIHIQHLVLHHCFFGSALIGPSFGTMSCHEILVVDSE